jgi:hypothetical protein
VGHEQSNWNGLDSVKLCCASRGKIVPEAVVAFQPGAPGRLWLAAQNGKRVHVLSALSARQISRIKPIRKELIVLPDARWIRMR